MKKQLLFMTVLMAFLATSLNSCKKDNQKDAPLLPPQSSFIMDMSDFNNELKSTTITYTNYLWAVTNVGVWNTILTVNLAIPVASFVEAFNHEAFYDPATESWVWSYNFTVGNDIYLASLKGKYISNGVEWKMYISKSDSFTGFLWYSGVSNQAGTEGSWILKNDPLNNQDFIKINWHRNNYNDASIKYENVLAGNANLGTYILYGVNNDPIYNAYYNIFNNTNSNLTEIKWHRVNQYGRIKDMAHFNDANWHCWDGNHLDVVCE